MDMKLYWIAVFERTEDEWRMIGGPFGSSDEALEALGRVHDTVESTSLQVVTTSVTVQPYP
jgi:hypothetical protein